MSGDLTGRPGGPPSRRSREKRAYQLVVVGGGAGAVAVIGAVLAIAGVLGWWLPIIAAVVAGVCLFLFRRTVS
jgi:CHASE2 domain-containing sensor protein